MSTEDSSDGLRRRTTKACSAARREAEGLQPKKRWSKAERAEAALKRSLTSGRVRVTGKCDFCGACSTCEMDENSEAKYCLPCWKEYSDTAARAAASKQRRERLESRVASSIKRGESEKASLNKLRHRLFRILLSSLDGIDVDELPALLCPGRLREVTHAQAEPAPAHLRLPGDVQLRPLSTDITLLLPRFRPDSADRFACASGNRVGRCSTEQNPQMVERLRGPGLFFKQHKCKRHLACTPYRTFQLAPHIRSFLGPAPSPSVKVGRVLLILDCNHILCERQPQDGPPPTEELLRSRAHAFVKPGGVLSCN